MSRVVSRPSNQDLAAPLLFCGTSGWAYSTWKPGFYPEGTSAKKFLSYYGSVFNSVEVNYTYTKALSTKQTEEWLSVAPAGFRFSFKAPQQITNWKRLRDCGEAVREFLSSLGPFAAEEKLGCVLFQLPHNFKPDIRLLENFFALPELQGRKVAFEFLHAEWFVKPTYDLLRKYDVALCESDNEKMDATAVRTAEHRYVRMRQPGGYKPAELKRRAAAIREQAGEQYVYLRHEEEPTGALNALALRKAVESAK